MRGDHVQGFTRQIDTKPAAVASLGAWLPSSAHSPGFLWQRQLLPEIDQGSVASWRGTGVQGGGTENTGVAVGLLVPAACILQTFRIPSGVCPPPKTALSLRECPTRSTASHTEVAFPGSTECVATPACPPPPPPDWAAGTSAPSDEARCLGVPPLLSVTPQTGRVGHPGALTRVRWSPKPTVPHLTPFR